MVDTHIQAELIKQLSQLPVAGQRQVLDYARSLTERAPRGKPGTDLLPLAGTLSADDCRSMTAAIEAGCEQVDPHEW